MMTPSFFPSLALLNTSSIFLGFGAVASCLAVLCFAQKVLKSYGLDWKSPWTPDKSMGSVCSKDYRLMLPPSVKSPDLNVSGVSLDSIIFNDSAKYIPLHVPLAEANAEAVTPTGFSAVDIKELGDFPDYASLSGVPLPEPYPDFDIKKAIARPYRPLRWRYHQTMCMYVLMSLMNIGISLLQHS
jgi:hypothetical protein